MKLLRGLILIASILLVPAVQAATSCVVLLHGLARSAASMKPVAERLEQEGYRVINFGYESTKYPIEELAVNAVQQALESCETQAPAHFVTHSMGGILLRRYAFEKGSERIGRVVMLGPPNQGSEIVDRLGDLWVFRAINGPAGSQLGTAPDSVPNSLGAVDFELGVIAGTASFNPLFSSWLPGQDDGKVAVERAKVEGMTAFRTIPHTHTFIMGTDIALDETVHFLETGKFQCAKLSLDADEPGICQQLP